MKHLRLLTMISFLLGMAPFAQAHPQDAFNKTPVQLGWPSDGRETLKFLHTWDQAEDYKSPETIASYPSPSVRLKHRLRTHNAKPLRSHRKVALNSRQKNHRRKLHVHKSRKFKKKAKKKHPHLHI
jgi:hypothetical protein